jgi:glycosyltransferase involved in cell wall biosynthesis
MADRPSVSVIIPVYNGERFLAEAIQSVLDQTLPPDEIIVVDGGSTDGSAAVAARYEGVAVLGHPRRGIGAALNLALSHARGDLIASLDADDRWLPDKLEKQVSALTADPALDMVFGHVRQFHGSGGPAGDPQPGISRCAMLVRRVAFDQVGAFAEDLGVHEFVDWYARAQERGLRSIALPDVVFERRIHDDNLGRQTPSAQYQSYLRALRLSVTRRRADEAHSG